MGRGVAVQRILRHRGPRITMEVYGYLTPGYLQAEVDRRHFGLPIPDAVAAEEVAEQKLSRVNTKLFAPTAK